MKKFIEFWRRKTYLSQLLLILVMMYCVSSINVLLLAVGVINWIPSTYLNPPVLVAFSLISFVFALLLSVYHCGAFFIRRKRKSDYTAFPSQTADKTA